MAAAAVEALSRRLGATVRGLSGAWYGRRMAAAERAIRARLPLVDLVLEVRDARIPASSAFEPLSRRSLEPDGRRVVVLNKADLADPSETKKWVAYMKQRSCPCVAINSHNMESIKQLLNIVRSRIREIKHGESNCTGTVLLVGIPNVGKSAIVNRMHQIGRIAAAGKAQACNCEQSSWRNQRYKWIQGAIKDSLLEEYDIAQFLLALVNSQDEYRKWDNLNQVGDNFSFSITSTSRSPNKKRQFFSDHTQDFVVNSEAFKVSIESSEDVHKSIALKLLNLYRTGRLGHYTLDHVPDDRPEVAA